METLLEILYGSGLRVSELCALRWRDLDLDDSLVTVLGKGGKSRVVPVGSHAAAALRDWRAEAPAAAPVAPAKLREAILERATAIEQKVTAVAPRMPAAIAAFQEKLNTRLKEAMQDPAVMADPNNAQFLSANPSELAGKLSTSTIASNHQAAPSSKILSKGVLFNKVPAVSKVVSA